MTSLQARLRKVTSEVEESENRNATMTKMLSSPAASRCSPAASRCSTPASLMRQSVIKAHLGFAIISCRINFNTRQFTGNFYCESSKFFMTVKI